MTTKIERTAHYINELQEQIYELNRKKSLIIHREIIPAITSLQISARNAYYKVESHDKTGLWLDNNLKWVFTDFTQATIGNDGDVLLYVDTVNNGVEWVNTIEKFFFGLCSREISAVVKRSVQLNRSEQNLRERVQAQREIENAWAKIKIAQEYLLKEQERDDNLSDLLLSMDAHNAMLKHATL